MTDIVLSQSEAMTLIDIRKFKADENQWQYPDSGSICVPLASELPHENFLLDIRQGRVILAQGTHQNRVRQSIVLIRLDFGGPPHPNPDGEVIACPHIHVYREGFADKWAAPLPPNFSDQCSREALLRDFMTHCHIDPPPNILWRP